ncbi:MAG: ATP synthase F0 subunit B [Deltaproteobacteria bacterium]|nr:ATP synthase F0 subunit B [Deltaproteobacteria bacterium]
MIHVSNRKQKWALAICYALVLLFFFCGLSLASGGGEQGGAHESNKLMDLLYRCINFAALVIIIVVAVRKTAVKDFFSTRRAEIEKKFADLKSDRDTAENRYQELEKKLKEIEANKKEIIEQFKADGAAEKEKIIAEARKRADEILAQADLTIELQIQAARARLRQEAVDTAAEKAREIVAREMQDSDQDRLVSEFIDRVEKLH